MNNNKKFEQNVRWSSVKDTMSINIDVGDKFRKLIRQQKDNASLLEARIERNRRLREEREKIQRQKEDQEVKALREKERHRVLKAQEMVRQKGLKELKKQQQKEEARLNRARARETNIWEKSSEKELGRRVRFMDRLHTKETRARERAEFKKWQKEIRANERRLPRQLRPVLITDAIRGNTQKWTFKGTGQKDPVVFLNQTVDATVWLVDSINSAGKKVNGVLTLKLVKSEPVTGKNTYTVIHCRSKVHTIYDNANDGYADMRERMLENFYKWQRMASTFC